jgi:hypothetical protein
MNINVVMQNGVTLSSKTSVISVISSLIQMWSFCMTFWIWALKPVLAFPSIDNACVIVSPHSALQPDQWPGSCRLLRSCCVRKSCAIVHKT